jgi:hypothetical protein
MFGGAVHLLEEAKSQKHHCGEKVIKTVKRVKYEEGCL